MASLCLSAASILRCESLTRLQNQVLIAPTALQVVFSTTLLFTNGYSDRSFLLVTAEGWFYFMLALLELLSHTLPAVRDSLPVFQSVDISLAAASFLPILLYTLFVFLYMRSELLDSLPRRFRTMAALLLLIFIPAIVALNEVASFIGISRKMILLNGLSTVAIGFNSPSDQNFWFFFTSLTLALLTAFQAVAFCITFIRLIRAFISQRNFEATASDQAYLFRGTAWIAGALKLGAIETVIGFVPSSFGIVLTRRILRFLSRAFLCIGIVKGVDSVVDFARVNDEMVSKKQFRRSQLRQMVSNPRLSTFQQLSPSATAFHTTPRAPRITEEPTGPRAPAGLVGMDQFTVIRDDSRQRVTIHFQDGAPTLHMRFSALDLPSPTTIVETVKSRPPSEWGTPSRRASSYYPNSAMTHYTDLPDVRARTPIYARHTRAFSDYSLQSHSDSIGALVAQFPGLPPRVTSTSKPSLPLQDPYPSSRSLNRVTSSASRASVPTTGSLSASNSLRRKPVPRLSDNIDPFDDAAEDGFSTGDAHSSLPLSMAANRTSEYVPHDSVNEAGYKIGLSPTMSITETPITSLSASTQPATTLASSFTTPATDATFRQEVFVQSGKSQSVVLEPPRSADLDVTMQKIQQTVPPSRIKSVGKAPKRHTPTPVKAGLLARGSIYIEPIMIPPKLSGMPVVIQEGSAPNYDSALRDSEVFGTEEDDLFVRPRR